MRLLKFLLLPLLVWGFVVVTLAAIKQGFLQCPQAEWLLNPAFVKLSLMILLPLALLLTIDDLRVAGGLRMSHGNASLKLTGRSMAIIGPACISFLLIGLMGWSIKDWIGGGALMLVFLLALALIIHISKTLPTYTEADHAPMHRWLWIWVIGAILTVGWELASAGHALSRLFEIVFLVGLGEELLFRGYLQSSFNQYFGRPFSIYGVAWGWGLILTALLFGLIHALVHNPPIWPWALFTFAGGLTLGFVREKDGSLLAPIGLHILMDLPMVFFGGP